ncbi:unnamed protein product [Mycena citricolor]|uniref:Uncharacterized protein n=1 Tax=Mycena citricolor TaxID=2018698 RepID=A0AAD2H1V4_9AGAR|nr:unnamed protein product [Mycena citricolor]CAK5277827.1 unnamed protein product [Mycena citricolor]
MAYTMFPSLGIQALITCLHVLGVTIVSCFISRRLILADGFSVRAVLQLPWARLCTLLIFIDSYLFLFASTLVIFGFGLQLNATSCAAGIYLCVLFYATSKILIYLFLTEKVYVVWDTGRSRFRSPVFLVCFVTVALYLAIVLIMFFGRIEEFRPEDGACIIGLKPTASIPLLSYDLYINVLLTGLFMWPLLRSKHSSARLRRVATRTLIASAVALTTSTVNMTVLTLMHGRQFGWLCLACCSSDVIFNAGAIFWVTDGSTGTATTSGARNNTGSESFTMSVSLPPTPARSNFSAPNSPARGGFRLADKSMFKIGRRSGGDNGSMLSPTTQEFQIHVTRDTAVSTSPLPHDAHKGLPVAVELSRSSTKDELERTTTKDSGGL